MAADESRRDLEGSGPGRTRRIRHVDAHALDPIGGPEIDRRVDEPVADGVVRDVGIAGDGCAGRARQSAFAARALENLGPRQASVRRARDTRKRRGRLIERRAVVEAGDEHGPRGVRGDGGLALDGERRERVDDLIARARHGHVQRLTEPTWIRRRRRCPRIGIVTARERCFLLRATGGSNARRLT